MLFVWGGWGRASYLEKGGIQAFAPKKRELVVHFGEWSTSFLGKRQKSGKSPENA